MRVTRLGAQQVAQLMHRDHGLIVDAVVTLAEFGDHGQDREFREILKEIGDESTSTIHETPEHHQTDAEETTKHRTGAGESVATITHRCERRFRERSDGRAIRGIDAGFRGQ